MTKAYILAESNELAKYDPTDIFISLDQLYENLEYGDVAEEFYQVWEYPNGKIYQVSPSEEVKEKDYYSLSSSGLWKPELKEISTDYQLVAQAYERLAKAS